MKAIMLHLNSSPLTRLMPFLFGRFISSLGDQTLLFVVPLIVFKVTGSIAMSGLAFAFEWLPRLVSLPLSGALADRFGGRKLYLISDLSRALCCLFAFGLAVSGWPLAIFLIAILAGVVGFFHEMNFVALEGTLPRILSNDELPKAQTLLQGLDQTAQILGPAFAALLSTVLPLPTLFLVVTIFFVLSALTLQLMLPKQVQVPTSRFTFLELGSDILAGVKLVAATPTLRTIVALTMLVNLLLGIALASSAGFIQVHFGRAETDFGVMNTMAGGAGVLSFFTIPWLISRLSIGVVGGLGFLTFFLSATVMGLAGNFAVYAGGFIGMIVADGFVNVFIRTIRVRFIPTERLSTTIGVIVLLNFSVLPLAGLLVSLMSVRPGIPFLLVSTGLCSLAIGSLLLIRLNSTLDSRSNGGKSNAKEFEF